MENYYGTPKKFVEDGLNEGKDIIILEIEVMGAMKIKEQYPDALLIFISAPSIEVLKRTTSGQRNGTRGGHYQAAETGDGRSCRYGQIRLYCNK